MGVGEELFRGITSAKRGRGGRGVEVFIVALLCEAKFDKLKSDVCEKVTFGSASSTEPLLPPLLPSYSLCSFFSGCREGSRCNLRRRISSCREGSRCTPRSRVLACRRSNRRTPCSHFSASRADKGFTPRRLISACRVCTAFAPHRTHK